MRVPEVSIIMNCFNSAPHLKETLDSVYAQTFQDWEIIFWDNLSTDNSAEIVFSFDEKIRYFKGEFFLGLGEARNMAISKASGEYIAILDCDDLWYPEKLAKQFAVLRQHPKVDLIYSDYEMLNEDGSTIKNKTNLRLAHNCNAFEPIFVHKITIPWPTIVMRKHAVEKVGNFSNYKSAEDFDILLKMANQGMFYYVDEVLAVYRIHANQLSMNYELAKKEIFSVYNYWELQWSKNKVLNSEKKQWLINGKKEICYISGLRALLQNKDSAVYFKEAMKYKPDLKLIILFCASRISLLTYLIRKIYFVSR